MDVPEVPELPVAGLAPVEPVVARPFPYWNLALFLLTVLATWSAGFNFATGGRWVPEPVTAWDHVLAGLPFCVSLLGILVCHEMGHFLTARYHRVDASWPYFIPVPFLLGTMGAVIRMRGKIPTRNALVDIGASGPLAGAIVAVPILIYGITLSRIDSVPVEPNILFGNLSVVKILWAVTHGGSFAAALGGAHGLGMEPQPLLYVALKKLLFHVGPLQDVQVHPVAYAGVIGLYITALNLVPIGQLDGGHVAYAVLGAKAEKVGRAFGWLLIAMMLFSSFGWVVWLVLVSRFVGYQHPPVERGEEPLSPLRRVIVVATVLLFVLTLTPVSADVL